MKFTTTNMGQFICVLMLVLAATGCRDDKLRVQYISPLDYPPRARYENVQGTVIVKVQIGVDGRVTYAKGSGAPDVLVQAAEENARQWIFGPLPPVSEFPMEHSIEYMYKLQGKPMITAPRPIIRTFLPGRVEISATPLVSDYPPAESYKEIPKQPGK